MEQNPHTTNLEHWSPRESTENGLAMKELIGPDGGELHPGMAALLEAIESRVQQIQKGLFLGKATNEGAMYANAIGEMRGLRTVHGLACGVVRHGRDVEEALKQQQAEEAQADGS